MSNSHIKNFIHGSAILLSVNIIGGALNYLVRRTLAVNLSITDFGFLYAVMSLCMLFLSYLDLGLSGSATILIARAYNSDDHKSANSYFNYIFYFKLAASLIIFIAIAITYRFWVYDFLKYKDALPFFIILSLIVLQAVSGVPCCALNALQKFFLQSIPTILNPLIILLILFVFGSDNINIAASAFSISAVLIFIITFCIVYKYGFTINFKSLKNIQLAKNIFHVSKWIAISTAGYSTLYYMDSLMLTYLSGLKAVGIYNVIIPLVQLAFSLLVFSTVFIPIATKLWVENKAQEIANICNFMTLITVYLIWPITISIIFCAKPLITILFSAKFIEGTDALIILFIGTIILGLANFFTAVLNTGGNEKRVAILLIFAGILNIILNIILIPLFDTAGAASATSITYLILFLFLFFQIKKKITQISFPISQCIYFSAIGVLSVIITLYCTHKFANNILYSILFLILINIFYLITTYSHLKNIIKNFIRIWQTK